MAQIRCVIHNPKGIFIQTETWLLLQYFRLATVSQSRGWPTGVEGKGLQPLTPHPTFLRDISPGLAFFLPDFLPLSSRTALPPGNDCRIHLSEPLGTREVIWAKVCSKDAGCLTWWDRVLHLSISTFIAGAIVSGDEPRWVSRAAALALKTKWVLFPEEPNLVG